MLFQDEEIQRVFDLMEELDCLHFIKEPKLGENADWVPESLEGKAVFAKLIAPENRQALRKWYARYKGMEPNPSAKNLQSCLERVTQEKLS